MNSSKSSTWIEENWTVVNGGGVESVEQFWEMKKLALTSMLNGSLDLEDGFSIRKHSDVRIRELQREEAT